MYTRVRVYVHGRIREPRGRNPRSYIYTTLPIYRKAREQQLLHPCARICLIEARLRIDNAIGGNVIKKFLNTKRRNNVGRYQ